MSPTHCPPLRRSRPAVITSLILALVVASSAASRDLPWSWSEPAEGTAIAWPGRAQPDPEQLLVVTPEEAQDAAAELLGVGALSRFTLFAPRSSGAIYADTGLPSDDAHILRSDDGGATWTQVRSFQMEYGMSVDNGDVAARINAVVADPRDPGRAYIGSTAGLFHEDVAIAMPPGAQSVEAITVNPATDQVLYVAVGRHTVGWDGWMLSSQGLYRLDRTRGDAWEDLSAGMPGAATQLGFLAEDPAMICIELLGGRMNCATFPDQILPEHGGWERMTKAPPHVDFAFSQTVTPVTLRVPASYPPSLIGVPPPDLTMGGFRGYVRDDVGTLLGWGWWEHGGRAFCDVYASRDGGITWEGVGGYSGDDIRSQTVVVVWDESGRVIARDEGLPGIATEYIGPWTHHPLDRNTLYLTQQGRGLVYRTHDMTTWTDLSTGLDPFLRITGVYVDSTSWLYVQSNKGVYRRQELVRPIRIANAVAVPDTIHRGDQIELRVELAGGASPTAEVGAEIRWETYSETVLLSRRASDGQYVGRVDVWDEEAPGYVGVIFSAHPAGRPEADTAVRIPLIVVPSEKVHVFGDTLSAEWQMSGYAETVEEGAFRGDRALLVDGELTCRYLDTDGTSRRQPKGIYPFGYAVTFYIKADTSSDVHMLVNGNSMPAGTRVRPVAEGWFRVDVPAEQLSTRATMQFDAGGSYRTATFLSEVRLRTIEPMVIDDIALTPVDQLEPEMNTAVLGASGAQPAQPRLAQNAPNPFNSSTIVHFELAAPGSARLAVYNMAGQHVRQLVHTRLAAGEHSVTWDGRDDSGRNLASGVYLCQLQAGNSRQVRKMVLVR